MMWLAWGWRDQRLIIVSASAGASFGLMMAAYLRWRWRKLGLPKWQDYPSAFRATLLTGKTGRMKSDQPRQVIVGYVIVALAFGVFLQIQYYTSLADALADPAYVLGAALGFAFMALVVSGIIPLIVWACFGFRAERTKAPLIVWFVLLAAVCAMMRTGAEYDANKKRAAQQEHFALAFGLGHGHPPNAALIAAAGLPDRPP
jgi:hypothetical protein